MPSVMDIQQQQQQQPTADSTNADPLVQATLALDKKQRNLLKRKEKLESYEEEAKKGKELNKDQKEALQKYPEVLGQIEVLKELNEQLKKIQAESAKNQKRLSKQAAEEKRSLVSQSLRQYAQIRYLVENRPNSLESDQSTLLDQLSSSIIPTDNSTESITRSVDTVLSIYQNAPPAIIKNLTGKTPQEVRETLDKVFQTVQSQQQQQEEEEIQAPSTQQQDQQTEIQQEEPQVQPIEEQEQQPIEQIPLTNQIFNDYPLQFDTRTQSIPLEQVMKITTFFQIDPNSPFEDENQDQSNDPNQFIPTTIVVNSNINDQPSTSPLDEQQQIDDQWQHPRGNGSAQRTGQFHNENHNQRNYHRRGVNHYHQQQQQRGGGAPRGRYDNSYGGNQRQYNDQNRGRPGHRGGNRGGAHRGHYHNNNSGNGYQKSAQYQRGHSATAASQQQQQQQ